MVSNTMLMKLHARLCEITGRYDLSNFKKKYGFKYITYIGFGGLNLITIGDFLQLPPVKAQFCFKKMSSYSFLKYFKSNLPAFNLWNLFEYR